MSDFTFKETEKIGLRKISIFYFDNQVDDCVILTAETIIEQFLSLSHTEFTKNGEVLITRISETFGEGGERYSIGNLITEIVTV